MKSETGYCSNCKYCHRLLAKSCISKPVPTGFWEWRTFLRKKILNQTFAKKKFMHLKVGGPIASSPHSGTRGLGICDSDEPLRDLFREISSGRYSGTNHHEIAAQILQMVAVGGVHLNNVLIKTVADEIFPAMAADLWSDGEVALLGVMLYWIDEEFVYHERLVGAIPFYNKRHTGDNILKATKECLQKYGCPSGQNFCSCF